MEWRRLAGAGSGSVLAAALAVSTIAASQAAAPPGHLAGRILDEAGTPFAGAAVDAIAARRDAGRETSESVASSVSDDRGEFRLDGLAPGEYYVSAVDPAPRAAGASSEVVRYPPTYYPGVAAADQAKPVLVVASGESPAIEFRLRRVPPARVSGEVVAFDARQLLSGAIVMAPLHGDGVPGVGPDEPSMLPDGRFSFGHVAPGRYQIRARGQTQTSGVPLFAVFSLDVYGQDIAGLRLTLEPGAVLEGVVSSDSVSRTRPPRLTTLRVRAPTSDGSSFGDASSGTVQADGSFVLRGVMKGTHRFVVDGLPAPWGVKEILYRGADVTDRHVEVRDREHVRGIRVTITDGR